MKHRDWTESTFATVYCEGSTAEALCNAKHRDPDGYNSPEEAGGDVAQSRASSRLTPDAADVKPRNRTYTLPYPEGRMKGKKGIKPPRGLLFGSASDVDFRLPGTTSMNTISGWHFTIFINSHRSWMLMNYSANGTRVNGFPLSKLEQHALYPDAQNKIKVGQLKLRLTVGSFEDDWMIYDSFRYLREQPKSLSDAGLTRLDIQDESHATNTESSASTLVVTDSGSVEGYGTQDSEGYRVLERDHLPASKGSKVRKIIDLKTGRPLVGKLFTGRLLLKHARTQKEILTHILAGSPHLIPFLGFLESPHVMGPLTIVTEYVKGMTLQERYEKEGISDPSDLVLMYGQLAGALEWVHNHGIVHRDLRPEVVITYLENKRSIMYSRLAGFSHFSQLSKESSTDGVVTEEAYRAAEMKDGCKYSTQVDMYSLSAIVQRSILVMHEWKALNEDIVSQAPAHGDTALEGSGIGKLITHGLLENPAERPTPSNIYGRVLDLAGTPWPIWPPFETFYAERKFTFSCKDGCIERSDILDALQAFSPTLPTSDLKAFASRPRMKLSSAAKRCHELKLPKLDDLTIALKEALKELEEDEGKRQHHTFSCTKGASIYFHTPSLMINISQVRAIVGAAGLEVLNKIGEATRVQVHGHPWWEGVYIDPESFDKFTVQLSHLHFTAPSTAQLPRITNPTLESRFTEFEYSTHAIIITERLDLHMVSFRRSDRTVNMDHLESPGMWTSSDSNMVPAEAAAAQCEARGLSDHAAAIRYLYENPEPIEWKPLQLDQLTDNESVTSLETTQDFREFNESDDDPLQFQFRSDKRRRRYSAKKGSGKRHQPS